jgi:Glycosyltransferase family 10 (fucosyltransferase) C-term
MGEPAPIRIKFIGRAASERVPDVWLRQLPDANPHYRGCHFIFDLEASDYDWLVVYDDIPALPGERFSSRVIDLACARAHTMLITMEPSSIKLYGSAFLSQFAYILSSQEPEVIRHPGHIYSQAGLRWYYGLGRHHMLGYQDIANHPPLEKSKLISTVCSDKRQRHTLHNLRADFTDAVAKLIPELEIFGHGIRDMDDKAEALRDFRYHIAIENHQGLHHWTEKLSDCFLAHCLPFYFGAPNAADYFPKDSFIKIDIRDVEGSAKIIRTALANHEWEKRKNAIAEARRLAMEEYSLFAQIAREVKRLNTAPASPERGILMSRRAARKAHPLAAIPDVAQMALRKTAAIFRPAR